MQPELQKMLRVPAGMGSKRYTPPMEVAVPEGMETPFIHPGDPASKQLQQVWTARVQVFKMDDPKDVLAYQEVWQAVCDARAQVSEARTEFNKDTGAYVAFCRWAELSLILPASQIGPTATRSLLPDR